ncbi:hypothetical protein ACFLWC_06115 [Chloroflexota bacterium]
MSTKYTHLELGKDVESGIARYYTPEKEVRLKYSGSEVLYVIGTAVVEAACCGAGSWKYAIVPGYIVKWQNTKNEVGLPVSEVEPISDEKVRENIRQIIQTSESASPIAFW